MFALFCMDWCGLQINYTIIQRSVLTDITVQIRHLLLVSPPVPVAFCIAAQAT